MENKEPESKYPELVAYLDGELAPSEKADVESRLASDDDYRQELAQLQKTWDMLDILPSVQATESFTQSTVEMVAVNAATQIYSGNRTRLIKLLTFWLVLIGLPVGAFCYGYWRTQNNLNAENEGTVRDLQIIQRFQIYRSVNADLSPEKSVQFLELLADAAKENDVFISFDEGLSETLKRENFEVSIQPGDLKPEILGEVKLEKLADNKQRFEKLESQKENLRKFHKLLEEHPQHQQLVEALSNYHIWFRSRVFLSSQKEIDQIKDATPAERMELVQKLELEYFRSSFKYMQTGSRIPAVQDYRKIKAFGREVLGSMRDEFIEWLATGEADNDPSKKPIIEALKSAPSNHHFFALLTRYHSKIYGEGFVNPFSDPARIRPFIRQLSEESKKNLRGLNDRTRFIVVQLWIFSSLGKIDNSELSQFEDKVLTGTQRSSLNKLNNYQKKREILTKAFFYTLDPFGITREPRKLPIDLLELESWQPLKQGRKEK